MDEVDAKLVEKAKAYFTSHYPDVLARLEKLPGRYRAWIPYKKFRENRKKGEPPSLHLWLCYFVESRGGFYVRIRVYLDEVSPDVWKNVSYCYHFGSNQFTGDDREDDESGTFFRVCRNRKDPYHYHQVGLERAYDRGHIPAAKADPPLEEDPAWFVGLVEYYVEHNEIPIKVKP